MATVSCTHLKEIQCAQNSWIYIYSRTKCQYACAQIHYSQNGLRSARNLTVISEEGVAPDSNKPPNLPVETLPNAPPVQLHPDGTLAGVGVSWYGFKYSPGIVGGHPLHLNQWTLFRIGSQWLRTSGQSFDHLDMVLVDTHFWRRVHLYPRKAIGNSMDLCRAVHNICHR